MVRSSRLQSLRRVKVYTLSDVWVDNGTGYCFGEVLQGKDPYLIVKSEVNLHNILLRARLEGTMQLQRQQDTLLVWTDSTGRNIALSFQEKEGCASVCDFIIQVQRGKLAPEISLISLISTDLDGDRTELITGPINYPPLVPTSENLSNIYISLNENLSSSYQKTSISTFISENNYITTLVKFFEESEKQRKIRNLHILCSILKTLILYNEGAIIEAMLEDDNILGVVGILEYDPDYPQYKANHRSFLENNSKFKEVLPIEDENIKKLIKKTFRLQYLKDVVLTRLLDDPTFNLISSLIHYNQVEIIGFLESEGFIEELFKLYQSNETSEDILNKKRDGIRLIHQFVLISKNLQFNQKTSFYKSLIKKGLFKIIDFVLKDGLVELRVLGTEIIVSIIEHDVLLINAVIEDNESEENNNHTNDENGNDNDDDPENKHKPDDVHDEPKSENGELKNTDESESDLKNSVEKEDENESDNLNKLSEIKTLKRMNSIEVFNGADYESEEDDDNDEFGDADTSDIPKQLDLSDDMTLHLILAQFLLDDNDPGLRIQAFEALKALLDPVNNLVQKIHVQKLNGKSSSDDTLSDADSDKGDITLNTDNYFNAFYSKVAPKLFSPLIKLTEGEEDNRPELKRDDLFIHLCELINFCSKDKMSSRSFFLENHILSGISKLIGPSHKLQLRLAAVRYLKSIIQLNDDYYTRYIISNNSLKEVFELLDETDGAQNLIFSTIVDLLEIIMVGLDKYELRKNYKLLANYVVSNFKPSLLAIKSAHSGEDLIRFVDEEYSHMNINQSSEYDDNITNDNTEAESPSNAVVDTLTPPEPAELADSIKSSETTEVTKEDIAESLSESNNDVLKEAKHNQLRLEKRVREEEAQEKQIEQKKRSSFKQKVQIAGKKLASKFSSSN